MSACGTIQGHLGDTGSEEACGSLSGPCLPGKLDFLTVLSNLKRDYRKTRMGLSTPPSHPFPPGSSRPFEKGLLILFQASGPLGHSGSLRAMLSELQNVASLQPTVELPRGTRPPWVNVSFEDGSPWP